MNKHGLTMKELSIKEKAKAYDEALERARIWQNNLYDTNDKDYADELNYIFPELKEEPEGERIRKAIISVFASHKDYEVFFGVSVENILAWLEKQGTSKKDATREKVAEYLKNLILDQSQRGFPMLNYEGRIEEEVDFIISIAKKGLKQDEQKYADKVKFKVGDWVVSPNGVYWHIDRIENNRYEVTSDTGKCADWPLDTDLYHLWTIADAKKGDVIACDKCILIFDQLSEFNNEQALMDICHCTSKGFYWQDTKDRDMWALDGFKPATKEQRDALFAKIHKAGYKWDAEKKELKKIEERPAEWRQDNVEELTEFENAMMHIGGSFFGENAGLDPNDTDVIKEQANLLLELVPKQEWSEEDERMYRGLHNLIYSTPYCDSRKELSDWLETIKQKIVTK